MDRVYLYLICLFRTEFGPVTPFRLSSDNPVEDWNYLSFLPEVNVLLKPIDDGSGLSELLILVRVSKVPMYVLTERIRTQPSETATTAIQQYNHENPKAWATMDLWSPHPTREGLWKHHGRMDSIVSTTIITYRDLQIQIVCRPYFRMERRPIIDRSVSEVVGNVLDSF